MSLSYHMSTHSDRSLGTWRLTKRTCCNEGALSACLVLPSFYTLKCTTRFSYKFFSDNSLVISVSLLSTHSPTHSSSANTSITSSFPLRFFTLSVSIYHLFLFVLQLFSFKKNVQSSNFRSWWNSCWFGSWYRQCSQSSTAPPGSSNVLCPRVQENRWGRSLATTYQSHNHGSRRCPSYRRTFE